MDAVRGKMLVQTTGIYQQEKMVDSLDVIDWLLANRDVCRQRGQCPGGCNLDLVQHETHGHLVCPQTYEPCRKRRLSLIIKNLERINGCKK